MKSSNKSDTDLAGGVVYTSLIIFDLVMIAMFEAGLINW